MSTHKDSDQSSKFSSNFFSGGIAAGISKTLDAPVQRVKILLQTQDAIKKIQDGHVQRYKGIIDCFLRIKREEGLYAFWRGNFPNLLRYYFAIPTQALNFALKDTYRQWFCPFNPSTEHFKFFLGNMLSGGAAGATSLLIVYPLDFARTRLAADIGKQSERQFAGLSDCIMKILKSDGLKGLYRGYFTSVYGIIVYRGIFFGLYDISKVTVLKTPSLDNFIGKYFIAQFITIMASLLSYPLDTVRKRLMMQSGREDILYKNTLHCIVKIAKTEGFKGFFKGGLIQIVGGLGSSISLVAYDYISESNSTKR